VAQETGAAGGFCCLEKEKREFNQHKAQVAAPRPAGRMFLAEP
jgi:hypothetical protein